MSLNMKLMVLFLFLISAIAQSDEHNYRVVVAPKTPQDRTAFPPSSAPWELRYQFVVPPLPNTKTWTPESSEVYIWGDVDFSQYGAGGFTENQIVPQLMIGTVYAASKSNYIPIFHTYKTWVIQSQYLWTDKSGQDFIIAASSAPVSPGDKVTTLIHYNPADGAIYTAIYTDKVKSTLKIPRPFLNQSPILFKNWRSLFRFLERSSKQPVLGQAVLNVETHNVDQNSVCSLLPFQIIGISRGFYTRIEDGLVCPTPFVKLGN